MKLRFRPSAAESRRQSQGALDYYAALTGKPRVDVGARPKRTRSASGKPLERDVLAAVRDYLRAHPAVAWVGRINRGAITGENGRYVQFNAIPGCSDLIGQMKPRHQGDAGAFLACEVKRPGEIPTESQEAFLALVRSCGGCAGWADSVEMVAELVSGWGK